MSKCICPCHALPCPICDHVAVRTLPPNIDQGALSALLTQTEAMLTIQRGKYDALITELQEYPEDRRVASPLFGALTGLCNEITLLDNVAQQLRAAGVIPK